MASTAQPIARPSADGDTTMASGSFPHNGSFNPNPASYTRAFFGSPISWRPGSFGSRFYHPGTSPGQLLGPLDPTDFRSNGKLSSSLESDRGSLINALSAIEREDDTCRNYTCCGLNLTDLHALVDHFEECHVVVLDPYTQNMAYASPGTTVKPTTYMTQEQHMNIQQHQRLQYEQQQQQHLQQQMQQQHQQQPQNNHLSTHLSHHQPQQQLGAFDPDDMELDLDSSPSSSASSPPQTPLSTTIAPHPNAPSNYAPGLPNLQTNIPLSQPNPNYAHLNFNNLSLHSPHSQPNSSSPSPVSAFDTTAVLPSRSGGSPLGTFPGTATNQRATAPSEVFNAYSTYADYNTNGPSSAGLMQQSHQQHQQQSQMTAEEWNNACAGVQGVMSEPSSPFGCVPPALLFSNHTTPAGTPSGSRGSSPRSSAAMPHQMLASQASSSNTSAGASANPSSSAAPSNTSPSSSAKVKKVSSLTSVSGKSSPTPRPSVSTAMASTTISRPGTSLLLSKPFRCPKPNCNKSYKQANGLKYHMTHGSCNFAPPKDLEALQALLAERAERQALANGGQPGEGANAPRVEVKVGAGGFVEGLVGVSMSENEMREVEREAERRLRPFACSVGECQRRYKNMNGLRYHYQHSGDHGAIGLALLASGQHECLQNSHRSSSAHRSSSHPRQNTTSASTSRTGTPSTAPSTPTTVTAPPSWSAPPPQQQPQQQQQSPLSQQQSPYAAYQHSFPSQPPAPVQAQAQQTRQPQMQQQQQQQQSSQQYGQQPQQGYVQQQQYVVGQQGQQQQQHVHDVPVGGGQGYAQHVSVQQGYMQ